MTEPDLETPEKHDPLAALRQRNFQLYSGSRIFSTLAQQMLQAVLAWQIYEITHSPLSLGFIGLARFFPALLMSMVGGTVADTYDRRNVMLLSQTMPFTCAVVLGLATSGGWVTEELIYGLVVLIGLASAFEAPARTAFLPAIVRPETFANAVTVNNIFQKLGSVTGPTLAAGLITLVGISSVYAAFCIFMLVSVGPLLILRYQRIESRRQRLTWQTIKEGVSFVSKNQILLGSMSLDMFAVVFGGAVALLPVYAADILKGGPTAFGLLTSAIQAGAFAVSFVLVLMPPVKRTGRALVWTVIVFGLLTIAFGLSRELWLSVLICALIGAADQVSVVVRQTTIQMATPDELRGRVSSVHQVFVQASNQLGAMESGFVAAITTATFAVVSGGAAAAAIAAAIGWRMPLLYRHEINVLGTGGSTAPVTATPGSVKRDEEPAPVAGGSS